MDGNLNLGKNFATFKTLEEARNIAKNHSGNEVIIRNEDKSYNVVFLDNNDEKQSVQNIIEQSKSPDLKFKIVELNIDGQIQEIKNIENANKVGQKISPQTFNSVEDALSSALNYNENVAVVEEATNTYCLYMVSQNQVNDIMGDIFYSGKVKRLVAPPSLADNSAGIGERKVWDSTKLGLIKRGEYLAELNKIRNNSENIILERYLKSGLPLDSSMEKEIKGISLQLNEKIDSLKAFENIKNQINIILSDKEGVSRGNLNKLEQSYFQLIKDIESGSVKINPEDKPDIDSLGQIISRLKTLKQDESKSIEMYNKAVKESAHSVQKLQEKIDGVLYSISDVKAKNIIKRIFYSALSNYSDALNSGNQTNVIFAAAYINKFLALCSGRTIDLSTLANLDLSFNTASEYLNRFYEKGTISDDDKYSFLFAIQDFCPEGSTERGYFENMLSEKKSLPEIAPASNENLTEASHPVQNAIKSPEADVIKPVNNNLMEEVNAFNSLEKKVNNNKVPAVTENKQNEFRFIDPFDDRITENHNDKPEQTRQQSEIEHSGKLNIPLLKIKTKEEIYKLYEESDKNIFAMVAHAIYPEAMNLNITTSKLTDASIHQEEVHRQINQVKSTSLNTARSQITKISNRFASEIQNIFRNLDFKIIEYKKIFELKNVIIQKINNLVLKFSPHRFDDDFLQNVILKAMEKLNSEITAREKEAVKEKLLSQLLDQKYASFLRDSQERVKELDFIKSEMNKAFNESIEVKEAQMSYKLKEIKLNDINSKIALISLQAF